MMMQAEGVKMMGQRTKGGLAKKDSKRRTKSSGHLCTRIGCCGMILFLILVGVSSFVYAENATNSELAEIITEIPQHEDETGTAYFYYNQLSDLEKAIYNLIASNVDSQNYAISMPINESDDIDD